MKRYRVLLFEIDGTSTLLSHVREFGWKNSEDPKLVAQYEHVVNTLASDLGSDNLEAKIVNYESLGATNLSVLSWHNRVYRQARRAFVIGSYFPALTAACTLGEHILNHLVLKLRDSYSSTPQYALVAEFKSCSNWRLLIDTLEAWNVLLPEVGKEFRDLRKLRNRSVHFNERSVEVDREYALQALTSLSIIVARQFGAFGDMPWFIPNIPGATYIAQDWESNPFVKLVYLPNSVLLGYKHRVLEIDPSSLEWRLDDSFEYEDQSVTDEEFAMLLQEHHRTSH